MLRDFFGRARLAGLSFASVVALFACASETFVDSKPPDAGASADAMGAVDGSLDAATAEPDTGPSSCPADMVRAATGCIDAREVTVSDYAAAFSASSQVGPELLSKLPPECAYKKDEGFSAPPSAPATYPVTNVDWCDAFAYCRFRGKRLCGRHGGGNVSLEEVTKAASSEWAEACTKGTQQVPYPLPADRETNEPGRCVLDAESPLPVDRAGNQCEGAYPGLFDMVGNVEEWVDSCSNGECIAMGSAFEDELELQDSSCRSTFALPIQAQQASVGFRCCK